MAKFRITSPDGGVYEITAPDDATEEQVMAYAQQQFAKPTPKPAQASLAPQADEPSLVDAYVERAMDFAPIGGPVRFAQGTVRGFNRVVNTVGDALTSVMPDALASRYAKQGQQFDAFNQGLDEKGKDSLAYSAGDVAGGVVATAPVGPLLGAGAKAAGLSRLGTAIASGGLRTGAPAATTVGGKVADMTVRMAGGAASGGASAGLIDPDSAGTGAAIGAALPPALQVAGAAGRALGRAVRPNINNPELARKAIQEYGIPLGPADISGSRTTKALRSVLNDAPLTGGIGERQAASVQKGFNRAVGRTFGAEADSLTPEVIDAAKKKMGVEFDRLWGRNTLRFDSDLFEQMQSLRANAAKLPQGDAARLTSWLDDIESKMVPGPDGEMFMPGDVANRFQSRLRQQAEKATGFLADDLQNLRRGLLDAFKRGLPEQDAAALAKNMGQYKAYKTVAPLLSGAEAGVAGRSVGDVPAGLLPQAVRQQYGEGIARSPFSDLSQIGSQYLADRVARTGGSPRAMIQNSALGTGLVGGFFTEPVMASTALASALGAQKVLGSTAVANAMLNRPQVDSAIARALASPEFQQIFLRSVPAAAAGR